MGEELRDIHLPNAISWWPPAPGWWLTAILIIVALVLLVLGIRYLLRPTMKKQAMTIINYIAKNYERTNDSKLCLTELSVLLRRVAITKNSINAGLTGPAWLQYLDQGIGQPEFSQGVGKVFLSGPYQPSFDNDHIPQIIDLCKRWVEAK